MDNYKNNSVYKSYIESLEFFKAKGYEVECKNNWFESPTKKRNDEILYKINVPCKDEVWLYLKLGNSSRSQYASLEIEPKYAENVDTSVFDRVQERSDSALTHLKLFFTDFKEVKEAFSLILSNIEKEGTVWMSELRKNVTAELFEKAYLKFMEQADKNAITGKAEGQMIPYGFSNNNIFDGKKFSQHFGQGSASKTPYINWSIVSVYYLVDDKSIALAIRQEEYQIINITRIKPLTYKQIGNLKGDAAIFYEATRDSVDYKELRECFLNVCEEVMRLRQNILDSWSFYMPNPISLLKMIETKYDNISVANNKFDGGKAKFNNYVYIFEKESADYVGDIIEINPFNRNPGKYRIWLLNDLIEDSETIETQQIIKSSLVKEFEKPRDFLDYIDKKIKRYLNDNTPINNDKNLIEILKPLSSIFPGLEFASVDATGKTDNRCVWIFEKEKARHGNILMEVWDKRKKGLIQFIIQNYLLDEADERYADYDAKWTTSKRTQLSYPYQDESDLKDYIKRKLKEYIRGNDWYPSLSEYDPNISKEQWLDFFNNSGMFNDNYKHFMWAMYSLSGQATCSALAEKFGNTAAHYNMTAIHIAEQVKGYIKCDLFTENGEVRYWPIMFFGRKTETGDAGSYIWKMREPLMEALEEYGIDKYSTKSGGENTMKNIILYGPPGTGKTYNTVCYAVAICEGKKIEDVIAEAKNDYTSVKARYDKLKNNGRIEFTTFHQSYGYEEFIEGIRPVMNDSEETKTVEYEISNGIFKAFCEKASEPISSEEKLDIGLNNNPIVWKVSLAGTGNNPTRSECMENEHIRIGYDSYGENVTDETDFSLDGGERVLNAFINKMRIGDIVLSCLSSTTIDAVGVITGDYEWHDEYDNYKRLRNVNWVVKGISEDISSANGSNMTLASAYKLNISVSDVLGIIKKHRHNDSENIKNEDNYVLIIDEINRGNISKIFGELITLIEPSKRIGQPEELRTVLPYSKKPFGVPDNVYILGTMNTADRSIAAIDTALRRRFSFKEMLPDATVLGGVEIVGINIEKLLDSMNKKISVLFDREHTIGHAYFIDLLKAENQNIKTLGAIFKNSIIPLLQEYFYEDYEKIRLVLGDNRKKNDEPQFIRAVENDYQNMFGEDLDVDIPYRYEINEAAFENPAAYKYT